MDAGCITSVRPFKFGTLQTQQWSKSVRIKTVLHALLPLSWKWCQRQKGAYFSLSLLYICEIRNCKSYFTPRSLFWSHRSKVFDCTHLFGLACRPAVLFPGGCRRAVSLASVSPCEGKESRGTSRSRCPPPQGRSWCGNCHFSNGQEPEISIWNNN